MLKKTISAIALATLALGAQAADGAQGRSVCRHTPRS